MEKNQNNELTNEQIEEFELAYQVSKEVVDELGFEEASNYKSSNDPLKNTFYKLDNGGNLIVFAEIGSIFGQIEVRFSLIYIAYDLIRFFKLILSDETASTVLKSSVIYDLQKRKIDILTLFNIKELDVGEAIKNNSKEVLKLFIQNTPFFTRAGIFDALGHSQIGYCQYVLKPQLQKHWEELGLPKEFNLITESELDSVRQYNLDRKKWFLGNKKQLLNIETLVEEADSLRIRYSEAKKIHNKYKDGFYLLNKNAKNEWKDKWIDIQIEEFQTLNYKALNSIEDFRPFELALIHLAEVYGYDEESMRKKITKARKQKLKSNIKK